MTVLTLDKGKFQRFRAGDIDPADRGLLLGDGVFETFHIVEGEIISLEAHAVRLQDACEVFDLPTPDWEVISEAVTGHTGSARLTITRGPGGRGLKPIDDLTPRVLLHLHEVVPGPDQIRLYTSSLRRAPDSLTARHKTLSYADNAAARREAVAAGADMALLLTSDGHVSGADCANVFWITEGGLYTPSIDCAIRPGVMRERILDIASGKGVSISKGRYDLDAVKTADQIFVTNSVMGPVRAQLESRAPDTLHPLLIALRSAIRG